MDFVTPKEVFLALLSNPTIARTIEDANQLMEISFGMAIEFNAATVARRSEPVS